MLKKALAAIAVIFGIILLLSPFSGNSIHLEARSAPTGFGPNQLILKNIGSESVTITDIIINDRRDCSTYNNISPEGHSKYSDDDLHLLWVYDIERWGKYDKLDLDDVKKITLDKGDTHTWTTPCQSIVRAHVITDSGSDTYTFSEK